MRYKIVSSTKLEFNNIELDYVIEDDAIGNECKLFGETFKIIQNGTLLGLHNKDWVIILQNINKIEEPDLQKLKINDTIDIYLDDRIIEVRTSCSYKELFEFLNSEWLLINSIPNTYYEFPLELRENNNLLLKDSWELKGFELIIEGSFERQNKSGRSI